MSEMFANRLLETGPETRLSKRPVQIVYRWNILEHDCLVPISSDSRIPQPPGAGTKATLGHFRRAKHFPVAWRRMNFTVALL